MEESSFEQESSSEKEEALPDRPLECSDCRRPVRVRYTEVIGFECSEMSMCGSCPEFEKRLQWAYHLSSRMDSSVAAEAGLACGNCGTTLGAVRVGMLLGCSHCYELFGSVLLEELVASRRVAPGASIERKGAFLHLGRGPGEVKEMSPTLKLFALNEALSETLAREDYEQAALLRDQIRQITRGEGHSNE